MTGPAKLSCYQVGFYRFYTIDLTTLKGRRVWDQVLPFDMRNLTDAAKMELIERCDVPTWMPWSFHRRFVSLPNAALTLAILALISSSIFAALDNRHPR